MTEHADTETDQTVGSEHYPLAWNQHGDPIDLPPDAAGWRVRRHKIGSLGGAPELVYDGARPLILPLDATAEDLIDRVGAKVGRYRLDAVDEAGRPIKNVHPAYAVVERAHAVEPAPSSGGGSSDGPCANCQRLMQHLVQMAGDMKDIASTAVTQSAPMITAASGVIVPQRPRAVEIVAAQGE